MDTDLTPNRSLSQARIHDVQELMLQYPQADCLIEHEFAHGVYSRKMHVDANTLVVGKMHRFETYNVLLKGACKIVCAHSGEVKEIKAPFTFTSEPYTKKLAVFTEESIWLNIHPTNLTDLEQIEKEFIVPEQEELELLKGETLCLG